MRKFDAATLCFNAQISRASNPPHCGLTETKGEIMISLTLLIILISFITPAFSASYSGTGEIAMIRAHSGFWGNDSWDRWKG